MEEQLNFGLIKQQALDPRDYVFGGITGAPKEIIRQSGSYLDVLPEKELQHGVYMDSMACVSFSALNCIEILLKVQYDITANYSDRALAKMSDTTIKGNYLAKVAETIRKQGLIPEEVWGFDRSREGKVDWDVFYRDIPQFELDSRLPFLAEYVVNWEWVEEGDLEEQLKYGPLQVTIAYASTSQEVNGIIPKSPYPANHAVTLVAVEKGVKKVIYDHYEKVVKNLAWDYVLEDKIRYSITKRINKPTMSELPGIITEYVAKFPQGFCIKNAQVNQEIGMVLNSKLYRNPGNDWVVYKECMARNVNQSTRLTQDFPIISVPKDIWSSLESVDMSGSPLRE